MDSALTEWERKAGENVQEWGLQDLDGLLLAMIEEMGELAEEIHSASRYPDDSERAERGRDLIRRAAQLGEDTRDYLETVSEDEDGEPLPDSERPEWLDVQIGYCHRRVNAELSDMMALGIQTLWTVRAQKHARVKDMPRRETPEPLKENRIFRVNDQLGTGKIRKSVADARERTLDEIAEDAGPDDGEPMTDGGADVPEDVETETFRGSEYPAPGEWELNVVEMDGVSWDLSPSVDGEGYKSAEKRARLTRDYPAGNGEPTHNLTIDGEHALTHSGGGGWGEGELWRRVHDALAEADPSLPRQRSMSGETAGTAERSGSLADPTTADERKDEISAGMDDPVETEDDSPKPMFSDPITLRPHPRQLEKTVDSDYRVTFTFSEVGVRFKVSAEPTGERSSVIPDEDEKWTTVDVDPDTAEALANGERDSLETESDGIRFTVTAERLDRGDA